MENTRGSEWRKWDLHVHTASSYDYQYNNGDADDKLVEALKQQDIKVVAISDHFVISKERLESLRSKTSDIVFFPAVELRTDKGDTNIHLILIFDDQSNLQNLVEDFNAFKRNYGKNIDSNDRIYWDFNDIINFAKNHDAIISIHAGRKSNGVDDRITNALEHNQAVKEEFAENVDIFEMGQERDLDDYRTHVFPTIGIKPMVICSDNHNPNEYKCSLWIKADPTFEGLKQILYEPEERVKIQEENPKFDFEKSPFTEISINNEVKLFAKDDQGNDYKDEDNISFSKTIIPLNDNLVSIIGGRGTGKSRLIDYISANLGKDGKLNAQYTHSGDIVVKRVTSLRDKEKEFSLADTNSIPFMYISQSEIKEIVEDNKKFTNKIKETIGITSNYSANENNINEAKQLLSEYSNLTDSLFADNTTSEQKKSIFDEQIKQNEDFIANVTSEKNKEKLTEYKKSLETLNDCKRKQTKAEELKERILNNQDELNSEIEILNNQIGEIIPDIHIPQINYQEAINYIDNSVIGSLRQKIEKLQSQIDSTKDDFSEYKGDLTSLLDNIQKYQNQVSELKAKKSKIESEEIQINEITTTKLKQLGEKIRQDIIQYKTNIESKWQSFVSGKEGYSETQKKLLNNILGDNTPENITLSVNIDFNEDKFYQFILNELDKRSWKKDYLKEKLGIDNFEAFSEFIKNSLNTQIFDWHVSKIVLDILYTKYTEYISHRINILVNNKPLRNLSVGQKGTIYLRLQLAANLFSETIIYDQPEDDLDNNFINESLVNLFKEIKKYRQVIIVSHNANLVVNADSEQIIVASNNDSVLSYKSGSLENREINKDICEILEGGQEAFEKREKKYGF